MFYTLKLTRRLGIQEHYSYTEMNAKLKYVNYKNNSEIIVIDSNLHLLKIT